MQVTSLRAFVDRLTEVQRLGFGATSCRTVLSAVMMWRPCWHST